MKTVSVKSSEWIISIGGFRRADEDNLSELLNRVTVAAKPELFQLMDADRVAGLDHIHMAAVNAVKRIENNTAISKSLPVETLLTASCQDQITTSFELIGVRTVTNNLALIIFAKSREASKKAFKRVESTLKNADDNVLELTPDKFSELKRLYKISDLEITSVNSDQTTALTRLLIERGALLSFGH